MYILLPLLLLLILKEFIVLNSEVIIYIVFISLLLCCIKVFNFLVEVFENQKSFYVKSSLENEHQAKHIDTLLDEKLHLKYIPINTTFPNITE